MSASLIGRLGSSAFRLSTSVVSMYRYCKVTRTCLFRWNCNEILLSFVDILSCVPDNEDGMALRNKLSSTSGKSGFSASCGAQAHRHAAQTEGLFIGAFAACGHHQPVRRPRLGSASSVARESWLNLGMLSKTLKIAGDYSDVGRSFDILHQHARSPSGRCLGDPIFRDPCRMR